MTNKYSLPRRYFKLISYLLLIIYDLTSALYGEVNTFVGTPGSAGSTNGIGTFAKFTDPYDCAISYDESFALIADWHNQAIRKIILSTGVVTSFIGNFSTAGSANGVGTNARLSNPLSVSIYFDNSYALVADTSNNLIRKIITATAFVTTFAGSSPGATNGIGTMAQFDNPYGVCISPNGAFAIVIEIVGYRIRYMDLATTSVTLLAGGAISGTNGFGTNAGFARPQTASISPDSSYALIADINSYLIRKIVITTAEVTTLAGGSVSGTTNGFGTNALFQSLRGLSISPDGTYVLVTDLNSLRIISIATAEVNIFAGSSASGTTNGIGTSAEFNGVNDVCISSSGSFALVVDIGNQMVRRLDILGQPTRLPSGIPSASPSLATVSYNFGVLFGHPDILSASQCLLTSSIRDVRRGKMFPISRIVNSSQVFLSSDQSSLSSDSILVKWRPVTVSDIGSWEDSNSATLPGGRLLSWLVSISSNEIMGFIVQDPFFSESYLIYFVHYASSHDSRKLSISDPGISIPLNKTISTRTIRDYVPGVSGQNLYLLNSGLAEITL